MVVVVIAVLYFSTNISYVIKRSFSAANKKHSINITKYICRDKKASKEAISKIDELL
jgi:hypothetical protein